MTVILTFLLFALGICLLAVICIWGINVIVAALNAPSSIAKICQVIIVIIALLYILKNAAPLANMHF